MRKGEKIFLKPRDIFKLNAEHRAEYLGIGKDREFFSFNVYYTYASGEPCRFSFPIAPVKNGSDKQILLSKERFGVELSEEGISLEYLGRKSS